MSAAIVRPATSPEAARRLAEGDARIYAGGTAIQVELAKGVAPPAIWLDVSTIPGRDGMRRDGDALSLGAHVRLAALSRSAELLAFAPGLAAAVAGVAAPAVRRLATLGGQVAGRTGCLLPALLALDAEIDGVNAEGPLRRSLRDWLAAPARRDDVIDAVRLPAPQGEALWIARKIGLRAAFTPSVIGVAALVCVEDGVVKQSRFAVGGGPVAPARLTASEARLVGARLAELDLEGLRAALVEEIVAPDDAFRSARYRKRVAANALVAGFGQDSVGAVVAPVKTREQSDIADARPVFHRPHPELVEPHPELVEGRVRDPAPVLGTGGGSQPTSFDKLRMRVGDGGNQMSAYSSVNTAAQSRSALRSHESQPLPVDIVSPPGFPFSRERQERLQAPPGLQLLSHAALSSRWHVRPDGPAKIAGRLEYLSDHRTPDMLVARILRAGIPHARLVSIDVSAAEALPGVVAVVTHRDVPGLNGYGIVVQDQPAFAHDKVRFAGEPVAAVAAVDADTAEAALKLIRVAYGPLPSVTSPEVALAEGAPPVHAHGNLQRELHFARGDVEAAFAQAAHIVEDVYVTPRQMHGFMETEGGWAEVEADGTLAVHAGGQHGARDRLQLSRILARPESSIRVVSSPIGGGFGGKDELTVQPALALLALKSGRRVRLQLSRAESVLAGLKRNPMTIRMRTGCDAAGRLIAQQVELLADSGAYASLSPGVMETALEHCAGPYEIANVRSRGRLAYTNNGVGGAFRGFGANQMAFAVERQIDRLAELCRLSPLEIRARNLRRPGTSGYLGQRVAPSERLGEMLAAVAADPLWSAPRGVVGEEIVGVGMAMNYHGNGLGSALPDPCGGALRLSEDGAIEAAFGLDEMGQGLLTTIRSAVAARLGVAREDIRAVTGDTRAAPDSGSTTASRGTFVVWRAAELAAPRFAAELSALAARRLGRAPDSVKLAPGGFADRLSNSGELLLSFAELARALAPDERPNVEVAFEYPKTEHAEGNARFLFVFGACLVRVAVNSVTGAVRVLDLNQHAAAGPVLDVAAFLGQQEGGAVQALGFTLFEDALMRDGAYVTGNLDTYLMPTFADAPQTMQVHALEDLDPGDPFGPRGAGELGIGAVTPAIANAIADAIGQAPAITPAPPEAILDILARRR